MNFFDSMHVLDALCVCGKESYTQNLGTGLGDRLT